MQCELFAYLPHIVKERSDCRRPVVRTRTAKCAAAGRAVPEQKIRNSVVRITGAARKLSVKRESAAGRDFSNLKEAPVLRLNAKTDGVRLPDFAHGIG